MHPCLIQEGDTLFLGQPACERRDRAARFHPQLVRAPQGRAQTVARQHRKPRQSLGRRQQLAILAHLGGPESLEHGHRLRPAHGHGEAAMLDPDAGRRRQLGPDVTRAHGASPALALLLPRDGDEAEIADRGTIGLRVALDHRHLQSAPRRRERMSEPADARPDNGQIEFVEGRGHRCRHACERSEAALHPLPVVGEEHRQGIHERVHRDFPHLLQGQWMSLGRNGRRCEAEKRLELPVERPNRSHRVRVPAKRGLKRPRVRIRHVLPPRFWRRHRRYGGPRATRR